MESTATTALDGKVGGGTPPKLSLSCRELRIGGQRSVSKCTFGIRLPDALMQSARHASRRTRGLGLPAHDASIVAAADGPARKGRMGSPTRRDARAHRWPQRARARMLDVRARLVWCVGGMSP